MISILLAEDQAMVRGALSALLGLETDIEVLGAVADGEAGGAIRHAPASIRVSAWSYQSSSFSSSCSASSGIFWATLMMVW